MMLRYLMGYLCHLCWGHQSFTWTKIRGGAEGQKWWTMPSISSNWTFVSTLHHNPACSVLLGTGLHEPINRSSWSVASLGSAKGRQETRRQEESKMWIFSLGSLRGRSSQVSYIPNLKAPSPGRWAFLRCYSLGSDNYLLSVCFLE